MYRFMSFLFSLSRYSMVATSCGGRAQAMHCRRHVSSGAAGILLRCKHGHWVQPTSSSPAPRPSEEPLPGLAAQLPILHCRDATTPPRTSSSPGQSPTKPPIEYCPSLPEIAAPAHPKIAAPARPGRYHFAASAPHPGITWLPSSSSTGLDRKMMRSRYRQFQMSTHCHMPSCSRWQVGMRCSRGGGEEWVQSKQAGQHQMPAHCRDCPPAAVQALTGRASSAQQHTRPATAAAGAHPLPSRATTNPARKWMLGAAAAAVPFLFQQQPRRCSSPAPFARTRLWRAVGHARHANGHHAGDLPPRRRCCCRPAGRRGGLVRVRVRGCWVGTPMAHT